LGNAYVTGYTSSPTSSTNFPTANPLQPAYAGGFADAFVIPIVGVTISASPMTVFPGGSITATWTNIPSPTAYDWIGLYASMRAGNIAFIAQRYTTGQASGSVPFTIPAGTAAGRTYELRLFSNGTYTRLATSNSLTIQIPTSA
jgi:hypothetical protein